jgi:hypothetical protein
MAAISLYEDSLLVNCVIGVPLPLSERRLDLAHLGISKVGEGCPIGGRAELAQANYERAFPPEADDVLFFGVSLRELFGCYDPVGWYVS